MRADFDVETLLEECGVRDEQLRLVLDHVADIVGQSAVGKRHIRAAIDNNNLCAFIQSPASHAPHTKRR